MKCEMHKPPILIPLVGYANNKRGTSDVTRVQAMHTVDWSRRRGRDLHETKGVEAGGLQESLTALREK